MIQSGKPQCVNWNNLLYAIQKLEQDKDIYHAVKAYSQTKEAQGINGL